MFSGNNNNTNSQPLSEQVNDDAQRTGDATRNTSETAKYRAQEGSDRAESGIASITEKMKGYMGLGQEKAAEAVDAAQDRAQEAKDTLAARGEQARQEAVYRSDVASDRALDVGDKAGVSDEFGYGNNSIGNTSDSVAEEAGRATDALPRTEETASEKAQRTADTAGYKLSDGAEQAKQSAISAKDQAVSGVSSMTEKVKEYTGIGTGTDTSGTYSTDDSLRSRAAELHNTAAANSQKASDDANQQASAARSQASAGAQQMAEGARNAGGAVASGVTSITETVKKYIGLGGERTAAAGETTSQYAKDTYDSAATKAQETKDQVATKTAEARDSAVDYTRDTYDTAATKAQETKDQIAGKAAETRDNDEAAVEEARRDANYRIDAGSTQPTLTDKVKEYMGYGQPTTTSTNTTSTYDTTPSLEKGTESVSLSGTDAGDYSSYTDDRVHQAGDEAPRKAQEIKDDTVAASQSAAQTAQDYLQYGKDKLYEGGNVVRDQATSAKDAVAEKTADTARSVEGKANEAHTGSGYSPDPTSGLSQIRDQSQYANVSKPYPGAKSVSDRVDEYSQSVQDRT